MAVLLFLEFLNQQPWSVYSATCIFSLQDHSLFSADLSSVVKVLLKDIIPSLEDHPSCLVEVVGNRVLLKGRVTGVYIRGCVDLHPHQMSHQGLRW